MSCPTCNAQAFGRFLLNKCGDYEIVKCTICGAEYCSPMPDDDALAAFYANYSDPLASEHVSNRNALHRLLRLSAKPSTRILDFGCGDGAFVRQAKAFGCECSGMDVYRGVSSSISGPLDWVTMWGVLEHLTEPRDTLAKLRDHLGDGGRLALTTVSIETPIPYRHKPPEHTLYFTRKAILALAERSGFRVSEYSPYVMEQSSDVYLDVLLRTMPDRYQGMISHSMPKYVEIPTNEVLVVMEKV